MAYVKHATIGALVASLGAAAMGFLLWAKLLDYRGPSRGVARMVGWMGLGLVTVAVATACLSIAFLQYLLIKERETSAVTTGLPDRRRRFARDRA